MSRTRRTPDHLKVHWEWVQDRKSLWAKRGSHVIGHVVLGSPEAFGPEPGLGLQRHCLLHEMDHQGTRTMQDEGCGLP
jgi:hypothetical protein